MVAVGAKPCRTTLRASLCVLSWLGNYKSCSSSTGCCGCSRVQNKSPFCIRSPEVKISESKVRLQLVNVPPTRPNEAWTKKTRGRGAKIMHIFMKISGRKIKGKERLSYWSTYLHYAVFLSLFQKKFSIDRLYFIMQLKIQASNVTLSAPVIFSVFAVIILAASFKTALKHV